MILTCNHCGTEFKTSAAVNKNRKFCSHECYIISRKLTWSKNNKRETKPCEWCGTEFEDYPSQKRRFCSKRCMYDWRKDQNWETRVCPCGNEFKTRKKQEQVYCGNDCTEKRRIAIEAIHTFEARSKASTGRVFSDEHKRNLSIARRTGNWALTPGGIVRIRKARIKAMKEKGYKVSQLEYKYAEMLDEDGVEYIHQFELAGKLYDFYISETNTLIEINGDYWHCNPEKYPNGPIDEIQRAKIKADEEKKQIAAKEGYNLLILWENDLV